MNPPPDNPCATCSTGQGCCTSLTNLRVTAAEYERLFARHRESMIIEPEGSIYNVSVKQGQPCPYWKNGCAVYDKRPVECHLFPYTIGDAWIWRNRGILTFHSRPTGCPEIERLLMPLQEARELVASFVRDAFGKDARILIKYESPIYGFVKTSTTRLRGFIGRLKRKVKRSLQSKPQI